MAALTSVGETPIAAPAGRPRGMQAGRRRRLNTFRYVVFTLFGAITRTITVNQLAPRLRAASDKVVTSIAVSPAASAR